MEHIEGRFVYGDNVPIKEEYLDEEFEHIPGFTNYMVGNHGNVWSEKSQKFLKPKKMDREGHMGFCLHENGKARYVYQHRIMAQAFLPNPDNLPLVRHLNDIPNDNYDMNNLAWGTQRDNWDDSVENGTAHPPTDEDRELGSQKLRKPIIGRNLQTGEVRRFRGQSEAGRILGIQPANIFKVLNRERRHAGGWTFEYEERK